MPDYQSLSHSRWDCKYSRVKAQLRSREILVGEPETSRAKYFGREAILSRRSDWMRRW
jgi:hypothetical protein